MMMMMMMMIMIMMMIFQGYQEARSFIVAESPTKLTAGNFWSMIMKNKCSVIVMLCDIIEMEVVSHLMH